MKAEYDIVVIGSGIIGTSAAILLSRVGARVLVVERGSHPRFAIGESTIPATHVGAAELARRYDAPEVGAVHDFRSLKEHGIAAWAKTNFFFGLHAPNAPLDPRRELMFETFPLPFGPDVHILRSETDHFLVRALPRYGVDYVDRTELIGHEPVDRGVDVTLVQGGTPTTVRCGLVLDCTGRGSPLAAKYGLFRPEPSFHTHTYAIGAHVEGLPLLEDRLPPNPAFRYRRDAGTVHHCFEGGWIWVIPFDNGITSVGLCLDPRVWPHAGESADDQVARVMERYPTIAAHLGGARLLAPWRKSERLQFQATSMTGPGLLLGAPTAGFIDPLFSVGISTGVAFIARLVPVVARAVRDGDFAPARFAAVAQATERELAHLDLLVSGVHRGFAHFDVMKQFWRVWVRASVMEVAARHCFDHALVEDAMLLNGAGIAAFAEQLAEMHALAMSADVLDARLAADLAAILDRTPEARSDYGPQAAVGGGAFAATYPFTDRRFVQWWRAQPEVRALGRPSPRVFVYSPPAASIGRLASRVAHWFRPSRRAKVRVAEDTIYWAQNRPSHRLRRLAAAGSEP